MNVIMQGETLDQIMDTLTACTSELAKTRQLLQQANESRLLNEAEACAYLKRDPDTLRYYRTLGLDSFKKGKDRWYLKADVDQWLASGKVTRHATK